MRASHAALLTLLALSCSTAAAVPTPWTVDDVLHAESATDWVLTADGRRAVWVKHTVVEVDGTEQEVSNLWLSDLTTGTSVQLTRSQDTVSSPVLSPDGRLLAFLTDREVPGSKPDDDDSGEASKQAWVIALDGGEAYPVTRLERGVQALDWTSSATLVVAAQESRSAWELERKRAEDDSVVVDDAAHEPPVRLFTVLVADHDQKVERLTLNRDWIDSLAVSPDGRTAVVTAQQSLSYEFDQRVPPQTFLVDTASGETTRLFGDGRLLPHDVRWAPDSAGFYLVNEYSRHPTYRTATVSELWYHELSSKRSEKVELDWARGLAASYAPVPGGVVALLHDGVRYRASLLRRSAEGWQRRDLSGDHVRNLDDLALSRDGRTIVYQTSSATTPPQWFGARLDTTTITAARRLTELNPTWQDKPTGRAEVVRWQGADDEPVDGMLHYPLGWEEGTRYPLILDIHGGPTGVDRDTWDSDWASPVILWRQRGAFVLQVNYHGSVGYGLDWVESIGGGRYYELEVPDLERGVDALIRRGLVDPERLGSSGWSNGGILTAELITRTGRYKVASVGAADVEWFSDWANVDFGASFDNYYFGGPPWQIPEVYRAKSPFFRLEEVTTPTIVFTGTKDRSVPPHQSWSLFRALQQIGKAPVRLVLFPDEPHSLRSITHQRRKIEEELNWFDRHLFETSPDEPASEAIKEGSLLEGLLQREQADRTGTAFGRLTDEVLVPETVSFQGLEVGRFEVTRAQFAAFDPTLKLAPGTENLPVTGISFERARAYAGWLAECTGRPFRLPTRSEASALADAAGTGGNTLDRWAGYTPNPDDAGRIHQLLAGLGDAVLLAPAGSLPGTGDDPVFDLDGNAAEWASDEDDTGVAIGASADRSTDPKSTPSPGHDYTGLRVVVGSP